jgi:hypothetical protein
VCTLSVKKKIRVGFDTSDLTIPLSVTICVLDAPLKNERYYIYVCIVTEFG